MYIIIYNSMEDDVHETYKFNNYSELLDYVTVRFINIKFNIDELNKKIKIFKVEKELKIIPKDIIKTISIE